MKKYLLLFCITILSSHAFANFINQGSWRWHKDDGSETTATYLANEQTAPTITNTDNVRLRVELFNPQSDALPLDNTTLAYSITGLEGSWILISDTIENRDFALSKSAFVTSFEATTQQLTPKAGYTFQPGKIIDSQEPFTDTLAPNVVTEYEWVIKPTSSAKLNTTYFFETSVLGYNDPLPTLSIGAVLPVTITGFTVSQQNNVALVKWSTLTETNNDRFEVLRSSDGQTWQIISTVKAKGNDGSAQNNYAVTDNNPLNGNSFYRLRQYDKDGKTTLTDIKPFTIQLLKEIAASIYPNPTVNAINLLVKNYNGNVTASLMNAQGTVLNRQLITVNSATSSYKLNVNTKLAAGTYYVSLNGNNLSQTLKVIVQ